MDMSLEQKRAIAMAKARQNAAYSEGYFAQGTSGLNEGIANLLGAPIDLANAAVGLGMKGINAVAGTDFKPSKEPLGGSAGLKRSMQEVGAIRPPSEDTGKQVARRTMQSVGSSLIPALGASAGAVAPISTAANTLLAGGVGGASAAAAQQAFPGNPTAEMLAEMVGSMGTAGATAWLKNRSATKAANASVPTTEGLKEQAGALYDKAEANGVTAAQPQTQALSEKMRQIATDEGLISPTGRVSEAYPKAKEALSLFDDYSQGEMTVPQMKTVRKVLSDAAKSSDDAERRIATMMLQEFDGFTAPLAPELKLARQFYHRAMKADQLETLKELAGSRAGQFSGSGFENALRTEYRGLERNMIKGNERGWTPDEQAAVTKVAQGTPVSNTARNIGKAAPTGPVSFGVSAGIPFAIGNAVGGPMAGAIAATGTSGIGYAARAIATKLGISAADAAELLARSGGKLPDGIDPDMARRILAAIASTTASTTANR